MSESQTLGVELLLGKVNRGVNLDSKYAEVKQNRMRLFLCPFVRLETRHNEHMSTHRIVNLKSVIEQQLRAANLGQRLLIS